MRNGRAFFFLFSFPSLFPERFLPQTCNPSGPLARREKFSPCRALPRKLGWKQKINQKTEPRGQKAEELRVVLSGSSVLRGSDPDRFSLAPALSRGQMLPAAGLPRAARPPRDLGKGEGEAVLRGHRGRFAWQALELRLWLINSFQAEQTSSSLSGPEDGSICFVPA